MLQRKKCYRYAGIADVTPVLVKNSAPCSLSCADGSTSCTSTGPTGTGHTTGMPQMINSTMWSQQFDAFARSFCEIKLIHLHPNNSRHQFFQPNCKSIMVLPMNMKEFDSFFSHQLAFFVQISSKL